MSTSTERPLFILYGQGPQMDLVQTLLNTTQIFRDIAI